MRLVRLDIDVNLGDAGPLRRPLAADGDRLRRGERWRTSTARSRAATPTQSQERSSLRRRTSAIADGVPDVHRRLRPSGPRLTVVRPGTTCSTARRSATARRAGARGPHEPLPADLAPGRRGGARSAGASTGLYAHQAETWEAVARGEHVVVTTGTASGKSLALHAPGARRDRARADGRGRSTSTRRRRSRRTRRGGSPRSGSAGCGRRSTTATRRSSGARTSAGRANVDPDEPRHAPRRRPPPPRPLGRRARTTCGYVVVDEAHVYRGVFGSHVGERPPAAAAARARVRRRARLRARVGDDRERRRARRRD